MQDKGKEEPQPKTFTLLKWQTPYFYFLIQWEFRQGSGCKILEIMLN